MKIIYIGSDHAGFTLKEQMKDKLLKEGYEVKDYGTCSEESMDYPDVAHPLAADINSGKAETGILICGSGNGVSMVANKYPNIRAALCWNRELAALARQHINANILTMPARFISAETASEIVDTFLATAFDDREGEQNRHLRRIKKIPIASEK